MFAIDTIKTILNYWKGRGHVHWLFYQINMYPTSVLELKLKYTQEHQYIVFLVGNDKMTC